MSTSSNKIQRDVPPPPPPKKKKNSKAKGGVPPPPESKGAKKSKDNMKNKGGSSKKIKKDRMDFKVINVINTPDSNTGAVGTKPPTSAVKMAKTKEADKARKAELAKEKYMTELISQMKNADDVIFKYFSASITRLKIMANEAIAMEPEFLKALEEEKKEVKKKDKTKDSKPFKGKQYQAYLKARRDLAQKKGIKKTDGEALEKLWNNDNQICELLKECVDGKFGDHIDNRKYLVFKKDDLKKMKPSWLPKIQKKDRCKYDLIMKFVAIAEWTPENPLWFETYQVVKFLKEEIEALDEEIRLARQGTSANKEAKAMLKRDQYWNVYIHLFKIVHDDLIKVGTQLEINISSLQRNKLQKKLDNSGKFEGPIDSHIAEQLLSKMAKKKLLPESIKQMIMAGM